MSTLVIEPGVPDLRPTSSTRFGAWVEGKGLGSGTLTMTNWQRRNHCSTPVPLAMQAKGLIRDLK
jgi:hypothetical protein